MRIRILYIGEIVSKAGVYAVKKALPALKAQQKIDFIIAGANGVTRGFGLGFSHAMYLTKLGIHSLTLGERAFFQKDLVENFSRLTSVVRPANYPTSVPGLGRCTYKVDGISVGVIVLLGQSGFFRTHLENPLKEFDRSLHFMKEKGASLIFVDFWACTTAEKNTFFHYAKGKVTGVFGSHGRVLTADAGLREGTASITGTGRTGSFESVAGLEPSTEIHRYKMSMYPRSIDTWERIELQGVIVECNKATGQAEGIQILRIPVERDALVEM